MIQKQFELTRGYLLKTVERISANTAGIQPEGFNNTIHWQIGHVLTVTEQFMFGFPQQSVNLPENYISLFGNGTKPADWGEEVPSIEELLLLLKSQAVRLREIPADRFSEKLPKPIMGFETYGELAGMSLFHEAHHLGQIHTMNRMIKQATVNS